MFEVILTFLADNAWNITGALGTVIAVVDKVADKIAKLKRKLSRCKVCKNPKPSCTCGQVKES